MNRINTSHNSLDTHFDMDLGIDLTHLDYHSAGTNRYSRRIPSGVPIKSRHGSSAEVSIPDWEIKLRDVAEKKAVQLKVDQLQSEVYKLSKQIQLLTIRNLSTLVAVQTFAPEPYDLLKPLSVAVQPDEDEFSACFPDANLTAFGDNEFEAVEHLKAMILDTFDKFSSGRKLGPGPAKQLAVLREFVGKRG